jgi:hypothetical protein
MNSSITSYNTGNPFDNFSNSMQPQLKAPKAGPFGLNSGQTTGVGGLSLGTLVPSSTGSPTGGMVGGMTPTNIGADAANSSGNTNTNQQAIDGAAKGGGMFGPEGLGKISSIADVIAGFGQIYSGIQANKIAKESLQFSKDSYATNLGNQIQSYNTSLEDRARARYAQQGGTSADADAYINKNRMGA